VKRTDLVLQHKTEVEENCKDTSTRIVSELASLIKRYSHTELFGEELGKSTAGSSMES
jgi:hypothetical protein